MKKILLGKTANNISEQKPSIVVSNGENLNKDVYLARKNMKTAYKELFTALLRFPDRQVQARVLDAINDNNTNNRRSTETVQFCNVCKCKKVEIKKIDVATQTTTISNDKVNEFTEDNKNSITNGSDNGTNTPQNVEVPKIMKRKHRRKAREPQVIKKSHAKQIQEQQQQQKPNIIKRKAQMIKPTENNDSKFDEIPPILKKQRSDSLSSTELEEANKLATLWDAEPPIILQTMKMIMMEEFNKAEIIQSDGLIPIHSAIVRDDINALQRQIYVWKKLKNYDLNELLTEVDEDCQQDCLQLAVVQNKSSLIVDLLIQNGLELHSLDNQSNTLVHLAVLNDVDIQVLHTLLEKINLNMLFKINDDGFTPLHLAIRQNSFLQAEKILNMFDKRCYGHELYIRTTQDTSEDFLNFYETRCETLALGNLKTEKLIQKRQFIDIGELRSGNTALFYAIENGLKHFIYLLLAHFADPRIKNHSGQSSRSYFWEFSKMLNLSLKIDQIMDKIEIILNKF